MRQLHKAEHPWKAERVCDAWDHGGEITTEILIKAVRSIFNKVTPTTKDVLVLTLLQLGLHKSPALSDVMSVVFEKAVKEPKFCSLYMSMIREMVAVELRANRNSLSHIRNALLIFAQEIFSTKNIDDFVDEKNAEIEYANSANERREKRMEILDAQNKFRMKKFGNIKLLGHIYLQNLVSVRVIIFCTVDLLKSVTERSAYMEGYKADDDAVECAVKLLETIAKRLEEENNRIAAADVGFGAPQRQHPFPLDMTMNTLVSAMPIVSKRVGFLIENLLELRARGWVPRRIEEVPKTLDEIKEEIRKEEAVKNRENPENLPLVGTSAASNKGVPRVPYPAPRQQVLRPQPAPLPQKMKNVLAIVDPTTKKVQPAPVPTPAPASAATPAKFQHKGLVSFETVKSVGQWEIPQVQLAPPGTPVPVSTAAPTHSGAGVPNVPTCTPAQPSPSGPSSAFAPKKRDAIDSPISTDSFDELTDECCCSICSELFDSAKFIPRSLECGHVYCEVCIYNNKMRINNNVKCPICAKVTALPDDKVLLINYPLIGIAEKLMKTRVDPKITCKSCEMKFSPSAVRLCIKQDCDMFNQLLCVTCALDDNHGGHVVKYDVKLEKIRQDLREEIANLCTQVEGKKKGVLGKAKELAKMTVALEKRLSEANIPAQIFGQLDSIASEQDADDLREIVNDLAATLMSGCSAVEEAFDHALEAANQQFELHESRDANEARE